MLSFARWPQPDMAIQTIEGLFSPPDHQPPSPPVATRIQLLPFGDLTWENFERLCHRLALTSGSFEHAARYGRSGQAQEGIDIYARSSGGRYHCWQAKRRRKFTVANLQSAVNIFLKGKWAGNSTALTIAIQSSTADTGLQDAIEAQTRRLKVAGINLSVLGSDELSEKLRGQAMLVDDFFGRAWVEAFIGPEAARSLGHRLDGVSFARVRAQLAKVYNHLFHLSDPGTYPSIHLDSSTSPLSIEERFLLPDVLIDERRLAEGSDSPKGDEWNGPTQASETTRSLRGAKLAHDRRRVPFLEWARQGDRAIVLGDAGSGKSTLLRCLALDLLGTQERFGELTERWGARLPLHIPFARWSRELAKDGAKVGLKEIVRRTLQPLLTDDLVELVDRAVDERRVLLLIDGLDEWAEEQAARTTLQLLLSFAGAHDVPVLMSARPRGFEKIGSVPATWKSALLAPFSQEQQRELARRWFARFERAGNEEIGAPTGRTARFMSELARDSALAALAEIPLLLVGLITLSLRGQILPRSKIEAYQQLVALLLEHHPQMRATAAFDQRDRFEHARDPQQRREALACLAFTIRSEAGDAGFPLNDACRVIRRFLQAPEGFQLSVERAAQAADEILAVNSEIRGLIVEKAPGEIGFSHASFEEFLSAEHLRGWSFEDAKSFVAERAGDPRWRNVIVLFLSGTARRNEFEAMLDAIAERPRDTMGAMHTASLLTEAAFTASNRAPAAARALINRGYAAIESGDWLVPRRDALNSALRALDDPNVGADVVRKLRGWSPSRSSWRRTIFEALATWRAAPDLLETLWRGLHDDDRGAQSAAAVALAKVFGGDELVGERLRACLANTQRLSVAGSMLEALRLGWPDMAGLDALFEEAALSLDPSLGLTGIARQAARGDLKPTSRDSLHRWLHFSQIVDLHDQGVAGELLGQYWADDDSLIESALEAVGQGPRRNTWDGDDATSDLLACSPSDGRIREWLIEEFKRDYPLILAKHRTRGLGKFAEHDPLLRETMVAHWLGNEKRKYFGNDMLSIIPSLTDDRLKHALLADLRNASDFMIHWHARCLLDGWGLGDDVVAASLRAAVADDARGVHLLSLVPAILVDQAASRARLLGALDRTRQDLLAQGLAAAGCDGRDLEAVALLLRVAEHSGGTFSGAGTLFASFGNNCDVRALALVDIDAVEPSFGGLILGYQDDPELRAKLLDAAAPLPVGLRSVVAEAAISDPDSPPMARILSWYNRESDPELKIRLSIGRYRHLAGTDVEAFVPALLDEMKSVGPNHSINRAAALVGLLAIDRLDAVRDERDRGEPVRLVFGEWYKDTPSLHPFLCEHWGQLEGVFGTTLPDRVEQFGGSGNLLEVLAAAPWRSVAAQRAFLDAFESAEDTQTIDALRAYAQLRPGTEALMQACLKSLGRLPTRLSTEEHDLAVVQILRDQFPRRDEISEDLMTRLSQSRTVQDACLVAVYCPERLRAFNPKRSPLYIGVQDKRWSSALILGAAVSPAAEFVDLLERSFTRTSFYRWESLEQANLSISDRLQHDDQAVEAVRAWIASDGPLGRFVNAARYLAIAGRLDHVKREHVSTRLEGLLAGSRLPTAIYDGVAGRIRSASIALFYALQGDQAT